MDCSAQGPAAAGHAGKQPEEGGPFSGTVAGESQASGGGLYSIMVTRTTTTANIYRELRHENNDLTWILSSCLAITLPDASIVIPIL